MTLLDKFKLRGPRLLVRQLQAISMMASGLFLPQTQTDEQHHRGIVERVGPGELLADGITRRPLDLRVGDLVYFAKFAGSQVVLDEQARLVLMEDEIQGAIDAEHVRVIEHRDESPAGEADHLADEPCAICIKVQRAPLEAEAAVDLAQERERLRAGQ